MSLKRAAPEEADGLTVRMGYRTIEVFRRNAKYMTVLSGEIDLIILIYIKNLVIYEYLCRLCINLAAKKP